MNLGSMDQPNSKIQSHPTQPYRVIILISVFLLICTLAGCGGHGESPLPLPTAAEPSAKMHNDTGIALYNSGKYFDALLKFSQASVADQSAGEIHFNIALAYHEGGEDEKVVEHFKLAREYAEGNEKILQSPLLNKYLSKIAD